MRKALLPFLLATSFLLQGQHLKVSENNRFLVTEDGEPFFWLADTAWELFHRTDLQEAKMYLEKRKEQGFNVIQAVALAELDGLDTPNRYGDRPLLNNDPNTPNDKYFHHVDAIIDAADSLGLYIALLPSWGDKVFKDSWGIGPEIFTTENARAYGRWIGNRYKDRDNVIWIIGGDRNPRSGSADVAVWNLMAEGIAAAAGGYGSTLMGFHPQPNRPGGSSTWFHDAPWLDFNMHQTGHCANQGTYKYIRHDYELNPTKPVLDGEPLYEDHPNCFNAKELGYSVPDDIRRIMYWNVFAGAFGQTYGCHDVWQMYTVERDGINGPLRPWPRALDLPMANQVKHLKHLMLSRPYLSRIPDQTMVVDDQEQEEDNDYIIATRDNNGAYAFIYFPKGKVGRIDLSLISASILNSWWYDPRTGNAFEGPELSNSDGFPVVPPTSGQGQDWILVVDDASMGFPKPGKMP
ncbi:MAG: glycoside hydrolase family 140 protein [Flavobacteriaceae bacterium]